MNKHSAFEFRSLSEQPGFWDIYVESVVSYNTERVKVVARKNAVIWKLGLKPRPSRTASINLDVLQNIWSNASMTQKAFKYRFSPTPEQENLLRRTMGCTRLVYNRALAARTEAWYERQERVGYAETSTMLTDWKKQEDLQFRFDGGQQRCYC